jgi:LysM repeat protein
MGIIPKMSNFKPKIQYLLFIVIMSLYLIACGPDITTSNPSQVPTKEIFPYQSATVALAESTPEIVTQIPKTPVPSITPFAHTIEKGETMLGIAIRYGVELEDLQMVNPGVDPNMLSVGSQLIIPLGDDVQTNVMTPTPIPISLRTPDCHLTSDGGAWCFVLVENPYPYALENVSARVTLYNQSGNNFVEKIAFTPLNRIGPGDRVPLIVFFQPPIPTIVSTKVELLSAIAIPDIGNRYLDSEVVINEVDIQANGRIATVYGEVIFTESLVYPGFLWIAAVAYGEDEEIVGVRKWEAIFPNEDLSPAPSVNPGVLITTSPVLILPLSFQIDVYSLGSAIKQVDVITEARP